MSTAAIILPDPDWLPHSYDPTSDKVGFVRLGPEARKQQVFLADFRPQSDADAAWLDADTVRSSQVQSPKVSFVFHSAFCRSTLLVKAIDEFDSAVGLSEPLIVNSLQANSGNPKARSLIGPVLSLLGRAGAGASTVVIKPSNFANGLIPLLLSANAAEQALFLYGNLRDFLISVLKKGLQGRIWARKQLMHNRQTIPIVLGMDERAYFELTDLQAAALAWLLHLGQFNHLARTGESRIATLQSNDLAEYPEAALKRIVRYFKLDVDHTEVNAVADGPVFSRHAKLGGNYSRIVAKETHDAMSKVTEEEIAQIEQWIDIIAAQLGIALPLARDLMKEDQRAKPT